MESSNDGAEDGKEEADGFYMHRRCTCIIGKANRKVKSTLFSLCILLNSFTSFVRRTHYVYLCVLMSVRNSLRSGSSNRQKHGGKPTHLHLFVSVD